MDCFGTYFIPVQTCDTVCVQKATEWTASVHTLHMSKPVITFVQSATEWTASVHTLTHVQTCDTVCVQKATKWTASVHTLTYVQTCDDVRVQCAPMMMVMMKTSFPR